MKMPSEYGKHTKHPYLVEINPGIQKIKPFVLQDSLEKLISMSNKQRRASFLSILTHTFQDCYIEDSEKNHITLEHIDVYDLFKQLQVMIAGFPSEEDEKPEDFNQNSRNVGTNMVALTIREQKSEMKRGFLILLIRRRLMRIIRAV